MYILNDVCYAGEMQEGIKVTEVKPLRVRVLRARSIRTSSSGEHMFFQGLPGEHTFVSPGRSRPL